MQVGGPGGPSSLYNPDFKNFAPRVAFAYDPTGKGTTVLSRRIGHVLRCILAGHVSRSHSVQLHLLSGTGLHRNRSSADYVLRARPLGPITAGRRSS